MRWILLFLALQFSGINLPGQTATNASGNNNAKEMSEKIFFAAKPLSGNYYTIYMISPDGTGLTQLFDDNYHRRRPIVSVDKSHIFYMKRKLVDENLSDSAWICKSMLDGSGEEIIWTYSELETYGGLRNHFDISESGKKLIYANYEDFIYPARNGDVYQYDLITGETVNLTNNWDLLEDDPSYSPDASRILYSQNGTGWYAAPWNMFIMNSDGTNNQLTLPNGSGHYSRPEYSPTGSSLVFTFNVNWQPNALYISGPDGSNPQQILISDGVSLDITEPTFSYDGSRLAFARTNYSELVITDISGTVLSRFFADQFDGFFEIEWGLVSLEPLPAAASSVTGPAGVCEGSSGVVYSVSPIDNATGYVWSVPAGVNIHSGVNTNVITVDFGPDAVSGNISVYGTNEAGSGIPSPLFFVSVHPAPADLGDQTNITGVNLNNGLIAYYPFNGDANDFSGNGNHGIIHGPTDAEDRCGNANSAMHFNGTDNWIEVPNSASLQSPATGLTISSWIKSDNPVIFFLCKIDGPSYNTYQYRTGVRLLPAEFYLGINGLDYGIEPDSFPFLLNEWFLFTVTYDNQSIKLYIDGSLIQNIYHAEQIIPNSERLEIGRDAHGPIEWFSGDLDELRTYNRALGPQEVKLLYQQGCNPLYLLASMAPDGLCRGENASLEIINAQPGVNYQLMESGFPYGNSQTGNLDTVRFVINDLQQTASFTVMATDTASGCSILLDSTFTVIVSSPDAEATAVADSEYAPATVTLSSASQGVNSFEWFLDGAAIASTQTAEITLDEPGDYIFILLAGSGPPSNCTVADTVWLTLKLAPNVVFEIPNSFTPNGDGINDFFEIKTEGIKHSNVWIKDRWGLLMAEFDGQTGKWDGTKGSGGEAPAGPYFFHVEAIDYRDQEMEESGVVYLVRDFIELSPNPVTDRIRIRMNGRLPGECTIRIFSVDGISCMENRFSAGQFETDVSLLKPGVYFIRISNGSDQQFLKFIKK